MRARLRSQHASFVSIVDVICDVTGVCFELYRLNTLFNTLLRQGRRSRGEKAVDRSMTEKDLTETDKERTL